LIDRNLRHHTRFESRFLPTLNAALEETFQILDPHARESRLCLGHSFLRVGHNHNWRRQWNQRTGPDGKLAAEPDIDRTRHMSRAKLGCGSHVKDDGARSSFAS